jgi:Fe-S cluster biogenesis protein NfuA
MNFEDEDIYEAVKHHLPTVNEYVNSHGGEIELLGTKNGTVYIELTGTCHGCAMSLMTTKMVVQKKLRELIHPELVVVNVDGTAENALPETYYTQEAPEKAQEPEEEVSLYDKIKNMFAREK